MRRVRWVAGLGVGLAAGAAWGQAPERERVVDFFQGPVVASGRVLGMGGAYVGVGEGAEGHLANPAAYAVRAAPFVDDWFDWDVTLSTLSVRRDDPVALEQGGGESTFERAAFGQVGFNLKFGEHGFGMHVRTQGYEFVAARGLEREAVRYGQTFAGLGYGLHLTEGWYVGAMFYGGSADFQIEEVEVARVNGGGFLLGALWAPPGGSIRLGARLRTPVVGREFEGDEAELGVGVPDAIAVPWEVAVGGSVMLGPRVYNVRPSFGHGEAPARDGARGYVLLSGEVVLVGAAPEGAVGASSFFGEGARGSGEEVAVSIRLGAESEVIDDLLVLRAGSYYEPSRYAGYAGRVHLTGGLDVRLFELIWEWEAGAVVDWSVDYLNWGLGVGFWY